MYLLYRIHDIINLKLVPLYLVAAQAIPSSFIDIVAGSDRCCSSPPDLRRHLSRSHPCTDVDGRNFKNRSHSLLHKNQGIVPLDPFTAGSLDGHCPHCPSRERTRPP
jgi:hypothetical protein